MKPQLLRFGKPCKSTLRGGRGGGPRSCDSETTPVFPEEPQCAILERLWPGLHSAHLNKPFPASFRIGYELFEGKIP